MILITGGAGFIGFNFALNWLKNKNEKIVLLDKLVYPNSNLIVKKIKEIDEITFVEGDVNDNELIPLILKKYQPRYVVNFAAETHVDTSIKTPKFFLHAIILGVFNLLQCSLFFWNNLDIVKKKTLDLCKFQQMRFLDL